MRRGEPRVVAAAHRLDTPVRWVHAIEFADAARLLRGGELVLATGIALPEEGALLDGFGARARAVAGGAARGGGTGYDEPSGWLVTMAGARGEDWGRVIMVCGGPPGQGDVVLVERTATALALARLLTRQHESLE